LHWYWWSNHFLPSQAGLATGQRLTVSGTLSGTATITGYTNPTTYILTAVTATSATLTTTAGAAVVTTAGTTTGLTLHAWVLLQLTVTVSGYDYYGQTMSEAITSSASVSTTVSGKKAFYQISSIAVAGATGTAMTIGTTDVLGMPSSLYQQAGYVSHVGWADTLGEDAATAVVADRNRNHHNW
jgi:hypothetical protein